MFFNLNVGTLYNNKQCCKNMIADNTLMTNAVGLYIDKRCYNIEIAKRRAFFN